MTTISSKPRPKLSFLIPAYNYLDGVIRICDEIMCDQSKVEVIISDDSTDNILESYFQANPRPGVKYIRRTGSMGAPHNWNSLLEKAGGEYVMLIHHDEYFKTKHDVAALIDHICETDANTDLYLLPLHLVKETRSIPYASFSLRLSLARVFPAAILRLNYVGPTACLVIKRSILPRFDVNLKWLVDMDFYAKTFKRANKIESFTNCEICSETGRSESITNQMGAELPALKTQERAMLRKSHGNYAVNGIVFWIIFAIWQLSKLRAAKAGL